eukprot:6202253-Pleurochrysis_carterae.AAC.2
MKRKCIVCSELACSSEHSIGGELDEAVCKIIDSCESHSIKLNALHRTAHPAHGLRLARAVANF